MTLTYPATGSAPTAPAAAYDTAGLSPRALAATDAPELDAALTAVGQRYACRPAVAAALWWKQYSWYVVAAALDGWAAGEFPDLSADAACIHLADERPCVTVRPERRLAPAAELEPARFARWLRIEVLTGHLAPILEQLHVRTRAGRRLLWGSVAHAIALPLSRRFAEPAIEVPRFLDWVGGPVADLVEITPVERADPESGDVRITRRTCCLAFRSGCADGDEPTLCRYCPVARRRADEVG